MWESGSFRSKRPSFTDSKHKCLGNGVDLLLFRYKSRVLFFFTIACFNRSKSENNFLSQNLTESILLRPFGFFVRIRSGGEPVGKCGCRRRLLLEARKKESIDILDHTRPPPRKGKREKSKTKRSKKTPSIPYKTP